MEPQKWKFQQWDEAFVESAFRSLVSSDGFVYGLVGCVIFALSAWYLRLDLYLGEIWHHSSMGEWFRNRSDLRKIRQLYGRFGSRDTMPEWAVARLKRIFSRFTDRSARHTSDPCSAYGNLPEYLWMISVVDRARATKHSVHQPQAM